MTPRQLYERIYVELGRVYEEKKLIPDVSEARLLGFAEAYSVVTAYCLANIHEILEGELSNER